MGNKQLDGGYWTIYFLAIGKIDLVDKANFYMAGLSGAC